MDTIYDLHQDWCSRCSWHPNCTLLLLRQLLPVLLHHHCLRSCLRDMGRDRQRWRHDGDDAACIDKNSPRPLPQGGDGADQSGMEGSAVMRLLSGSAPGNVSNGCPDSSGDWRGDVNCLSVVVSGRSAKHRRDGDDGAERSPVSSL
jgi:hypothetical protein